MLHFMYILSQEAAGCPKAGCTLRVLPTHSSVLRNCATHVACWRDVVTISLSPRWARTPHGELIVCYSTQTHRITNKASPFSNSSRKKSRMPKGRVHATRATYTLVSPAQLRNTRSLLARCRDNLSESQMGENPPRRAHCLF